MLEVAVFDEAPSGSQAPGVEMEYGEPYLRGCLGVVQPESERRGDANDVTTI